MNRKKVMLVDDEEDIAVLLKEDLEIHAPYDVVLYSDSQRAIDDF